MNLVLQEVFEMSTKEDKWDHVKHMPYANEEKFPIPIGPYHWKWLKASYYAERKQSGGTLMPTRIC